MQQSIRFFLMLLLTGLLSSCGGGPAEPELTINSLGDLKSRGKAVVVIQAIAGEAGYKGKAMGSTWALDGLKVNMTAPEKKLTTIGYGRKLFPRIAELSPGTYHLMEFNYRVGRGGRTVENKSGMTGLPLASFTIKAGEVVYLGKFIAQTRTNVAILNTTRRFDLSVKNEQNIARSWLAQKSPELAAQMKTRLIQISPLFATIKSMAAQQKK